MCAKNWWMLRCTLLEGIQIGSRLFSRSGVRRSASWWVGLWWVTTIYCPCARVRDGRRMIGVATRPNGEWDGFLVRRRWQDVPLEEGVLILCIDVICASTGINCWMNACGKHYFQVGICCDKHRNLSGHSHQKGALFQWFNNVRAFVYTFDRDGSHG